MFAADLQRLLVFARARDAAAADRQEPGGRRGCRAAEALQGLGPRRRPALSLGHVTFEEDARSTTTATPKTTAQTDGTGRRSSLIKIASA